MTDSRENEQVSLEQILELEDKYLMTTGKAMPVAFVRGSGMRVWDTAGKEYLDLIAGIAVNALGHANPEVAAAIARQSQQLIHTSGLYHTAGPSLLAKRLVELSFPSRAFFNNSGAEANETAFKIARKWGKKHRGGAFEIISAHRSFHGRTLATITAGGQEKYSAPFAPLPPGFVHVVYNDLEALKAATTDNTVAIFLEPVIGEGGVIPATAEYLKGVRAWCDEKDLLLILDEIQTGIGRTGRWFAHQHYGITPDVMTLAKALGGGLPIGATLANPRADVFEAGDHGSTFGGNPVVLAAAMTTLDVIERDHLVENAAEMGDLLQQVFEGFGQKDARGIGLMRAFTFEEPRAKAFQLKALENGIIVNAIDDNSIRVVPPLIIGAAEIERAQAGLEVALKAV